MRNEDTGASVHAKKQLQQKGVEDNAIHQKESSGMISELMEIEKPGHEREGSRICLAEIDQNRMGLK